MRHPLPSLVSFRPRLLWRVHLAEYRSAQTRAAPDDNACFSPIYRANGTPIRVLYAATQLSAALKATVFHDMPRVKAGHLLDITRLRERKLCVSCIRPLHTLRLVDLSAQGLERLGLDPEQLMQAPVGAYPHSRAWAKQWYVETAAQGLLWDLPEDKTHRRSGHGMLLFGDRVQELKFAVRVSQVPLCGELTMQSVLAVARQLKVGGMFGS